MPNYAVIGPQYRVFYNFYGSPDSVFPAVKNAIDEFSSTMIYGDLIEDFTMNVSQSVELDLSDLFISTAGDITLSIEHNSNPDIATLNLDDKTLTIVSNDQQGVSEVTIKGYNGTESKYDKFEVTIQNSSLEIIYSEDFEEEPTDWIYADTVVGWRWGAASDFPVIGEWEFQEHTKFMGINADETAMDSLTQDLAISPEIDLSGYTNLQLQFDFCFKDDDYYYFASLMTVSYRVSPEDDWVEVANFDDLVQVEWIEHSLFLPDEAASETFQLGFYFTEEGEWGWAGGFDDIIISGFDGSDIDEVEKSYTLLENYPNPFNPSTTIKFQNSVDGAVNLSVFNSMGQIVTTLVDDNLSAGTHSINFDGSGLNSGVYFYRLSTDGGTVSKKMILVK